MIIAVMLFALAMPGHAWAKEWYENGCTTRGQNSTKRDAKSDLSKCLNRIRKNKEISSFSLIGEPECWYLPSKGKWSCKQRFKYK